MVEMVYHQQLNAALGPELRFLGTTLNATSLNSWFGSLLVLVTGVALFELVRRQFSRDWSEIQEEIEKETQRRDALGQRINGKKPFEINRLGLSRSFQITNIFPKLSVFENLRCGVLWSLGYKYTFLKFLANLKDANDRAEELMRMIHLERKHDTLAMNLTYMKDILLMKSEYCPRIV
eukprot:gene30158-52256_t